MVEQWNLEVTGNEKSQADNPKTAPPLFAFSTLGNGRAFVERIDEGEEICGIIK